MSGEGSPRRPDTRPLRLGLRREGLILLPTSLALLMVLSTLTLYAYRNGLDRLADTRREEAARAARVAATDLATAPGGDDAELRRAAPDALAAAILDAAGRPLVSAGDLPSSGLLDPVGGLPPAQPTARGPGGDLGGRVVGFAPLPGPDGRTLRLDLPAPVLAGQLRGSRVLTAVVLAVNGGVLLLAILFLRQLLAPYETLLERARQLGGSQPAAEDEITFLVTTFERAMAALARQQAGEGAGDDVEADIRVLERTLSGSVESGLLLLDLAGEVLSLNPAGAELLGVTAPTPGTPLGAAFPGHPELEAVLAEAVGEQRGVQRREIGTGGLTLGLTVHPLRRDDGRLRGYLVLFADLTEARRSEHERRLTEGMERLGEMAAGVAHELRNSLATLSGYLTLIERRPEEESITDYLGEIRRETDHLGRVLTDFLAFARPGTVRAETVELHALARRVAGDPALGGAQVVVSSGGEARLEGDPQLLERLLRNLLRNAVEAQRRAGVEGSVEVGLAGAVEGVEVTVADRGPGLPESVRERLFHPFVTGRPDGVGLGLAVSHRIATLHGGSLEITDRGGGGTCARLVFPSGTFVEKGNKS